MGNPLTIIDTMRGFIEEAGFEVKGVVQKKYPANSWPKNLLYKEAGRVGVRRSSVLNRSRFLTVV